MRRGMRWLALAGTLAIAAWGQPPRGFYPWWDRPVAKDLNLSDAQIRDVRGTIRDFRGKLLEQRAALEKAETELEDALNQDTVDRARANQAVEDLAMARENLTRTFSQIAVRMRMILTPQQWRELQDRQFRRRGKGRQ